MACERYSRSRIHEKNTAPYTEKEDRDVMDESDSRESAGTKMIGKRFLVFTV